MMAASLVTVAPSVAADAGAKRLIANNCVGNAVIIGVDGRCHIQGFTPIAAAISGLGILTGALFDLLDGFGRCHLWRCRGCSGAMLVAKFGRVRSTLPKAFDTVMAPSVAPNELGPGPTRTIWLPPSSSTMPATCVPRMLMLADGSLTFIASGLDFGKLAGDEPERPLVICVVIEPDCAAGS